MICSEDRKNVRKFLEDLLEEAEYQRVRRHVENCPACTQFTHTAGSVSSMLMEMGRSIGAEDLVENIMFQYEKRRRGGIPVPAPPAAVPSVRPPVQSSSKGLKILVTVFVFLVIGLAWRDWVQTRLLQEVLRSGVTAPAAKPAANAEPPTMPGDFEWGNIRVHWSQGSREDVSNLIRRFSPDIRYEAPGLLVARVPSGRDAEWMSALRGLPGAAIEEGAAAIVSETDRLYTIEYQGS